MHILQPKHSRISEKEAEEILKKFNISKAQLPKISLTDPALPEDCQTGEIIKVQRKEDENIFVSYRVVV